MISSTSFEWSHLHSQTVQSMDRPDPAYSPSHISRYAETPRSQGITPFISKRGKRGQYKTTILLCPLSFLRLGSNHCRECRDVCLSAFTETRFPASYSDASSATDGSGAPVRLNRESSWLDGSWSSCQCRRDPFILESPQMCPLLLFTSIPRQTPTLQSQRYFQSDSASSIPPLLKLPT